MIKGEIAKSFALQEIIVAEYLIGDPCNNGYDQFSVSICHYHMKGRRDEDKRQFKNNTYYLISAGTSEVELNKFFPELKAIAKMNGCDIFGLPSYPIMNSMYYLETDLNYGIKYLRLTKKEAHILVNYKPISFINYLKNLINTRYKKEVQDALDLIEKLTSEKYKIKDKVSPALYNDINYVLLTEKNGWNIYKGQKNVTNYPLEGVK